MAKRQLHRFPIAVAYLFRPRQVDNEVDRPLKDTNTSTATIPKPTQNAKPKTASVSPDASGVFHQIIKYCPPHLSRWWLLWVSICLIFGGTGIVSFLLLTSVPPLPNCRKLSPVAADGERLYCAQMAAESGKLNNLVAAIEVVESWPKNHSLYLEAQRMMGNWSQQLLVLAEQKIDQGDLKGALAITARIPASSPLYNQTQLAITNWQEQWKQGEEITNQFQNAVKQQNWKQAWQQLEVLLGMNSRYWRSSQYDRLTLQLAVEKQAWQHLTEARDLAKDQTPEQLAAAIAKAGEVDSKSYFSSEAQADKDKWSRALLEIAATKFKSEDFGAVVAVAQGIPSDVSVYSQAQDWIRLSRAADVARNDNLLALLDAVSTTRQIDQKSPLYSLATMRRSMWESQLQDRMQLQLARTIASFDQRMTLQLAIEQAQQVAPSRPGRIEAQTLIATWYKQIEQIQDRATLASAQELAARGTIESLNTAIKKASEIELGHALRIEAQTAIAQWNKQIQTVEDRPILDLARAFAQHGNLLEAIQAAQQIRPARALYADAQAAIDGWVDEIQIAEDRPLLDAARALAAQGRFFGAIQTASQIRVNRPLYEEAQSAIAQWQPQIRPLQPLPENFYRGRSRRLNNTDSP